MFNRNTRKADRNESNHSGRSAPSIKYLYVAINEVGSPMPGPQQSLRKLLRRNQNIDRTGYSRHENARVAVKSGLKMQTQRWRYKHFKMKCHQRILKTSSIAYTEINVLKTICNDVAYPK